MLSRRLRNGEHNILEIEYKKKKNLDNLKTYKKRVIFLFDQTTTKRDFSAAKELIQI